MSETITDALEKLSVKLGGEEKDSETIVDALKQIYSAYGGTGDLTEADTIAEMIDEITKVASSGGGGGGSSDITTATVTVTKGAGQTTDESAFVYAIFGKSAGSFEVPFMSIEYGGLDQGAIEYTILLYQGCYYMEDEFGSVESASGNVETITGDLFNTYRIYGDCAFVTKELFDM